MAIRRLYFDPFAVPAVVPAPAAAWNDIEDMKRRTLRATPFVGANGVDIASGDEAVIGQRVMLSRQYVDPAPLPAGDVTGTVAAVMRASASFASSSIDYVRMIVRVVSADGTIERGVLCDAQSAAEIPTPSALATRVVSAVLSPVTASAGDLLVVELGAIGGLGSGTNSGFSLYLGGQPAAAADYAFVDGDSSEVKFPWVEFALDDPPPPPTPVDADRRWWTHRLAAAAGLDPVDSQPVVQVRVWDGSGFVVDDTLSRGLQSYQVTYGRKDTTSRVEPLTCALVWATPALTSTPGVATRLQVALSPAFCDAIGLDPDDGIRFTGEVTDPAVAHARRLTTAATAGRLGRGHRMPVDGTGWPVESDAARIARILPAARVDLQVGTIDPPAVNVAPPTRLETAATLLEKTSTSALGQVVEQPSGVIDWHGPDHRRDPAVAVTLTAGQVLRDVTWSQRLASLVNDLDVKLDDGTVVTITDPESSDPNRYGPWPASIDTILTSTTDAGGLGVDVVGRRADPSWQLPDLTLDLVRTIPIVGTLPAVLALRHGSLLEVTDLPVGFPLAAGRMFVEGYVETATPRTWSLVLQVSDPLQSGVGIRWIDWPDTDAYQWQDLDPDLTWLDLARIYDPADTL